MLRARHDLAGRISKKAYLPGTGVNHDHQGGSPRVRLFHCTSVELTPAIAPNVGNSSAQFLLVGGLRSRCLLII